MNESVKQALEKDLTIDITTRGRKTGEPRRTEIWFHNLEGKSTSRARRAAETGTLTFSPILTSPFISRRASRPNFPPARDPLLRWPNAARYCLAS